MPPRPLAVRAEGLWKTYRIHPPGTPRGLLRHPTVEFHALKDVNFDVPEGAVLGIVGHNGAGKSTLLKVLSRITDPSRGRVRVAGRVASLLEVGTGFHPELTGLENLYLNAAIHGLKRREIRARLEAILSFAEIGDFLHEPVKHYSSGMYLRLAFSVAAHLDPDILIVDELLAVGDGAFQAKCLGRFDEMHRQGRTVIVVSHDLRLVERICTSALQLVGGAVGRQGSTQVVLGEYRAMAQRAGARWQRDGAVEASATGPCAGGLLRAWASRPGSPAPVDTLYAREGCVIHVEYRVPPPGVLGRVYVSLHNEAGNLVLTSTSADSADAPFVAMEGGMHQAACAVPAGLLAPGRYEVTFGVAQRDDSYEEIAHAFCFTALGEGGLLHAHGRVGAVAPLLAWTDTLDAGPSSEMPT